MSEKLNCPASFARVTASSFPVFTLRRRRLAEAIGLLSAVHALPRIDVAGPGAISACSTEAATSSTATAIDAGSLTISRLWGRPDDSPTLWFGGVKTVA